MAFTFMKWKTLSIILERVNQIMIYQIRFIIIKVLNYVYFILKGVGLFEINK